MKGWRQKRFMYCTFILNTQLKVQNWKLKERKKEISVQNKKKKKKKKGKHFKEKKDERKTVKESLTV